MLSFEKKQLSKAAMASAFASILAISLVACDISDKADNRSAGEVVSDALLTTRIKSALMANPGVNSFDIKVKTRNGEVAMSGHIANQAQLDLATSIIHSIDGVRAIQSNVSLENNASIISN